MRIQDYYIHPVEEWSALPIDIKKRFVKSVRDRLLAESDWTQLPDAVLTEAERTAWQDYRQALRDIPQDFANPDDVIFPTRPQ